ncbi:MAG: SGNH/GDSL hydrolase family protein [Chitinophagales bacterium]
MRQSYIFILLLSLLFLQATCDKENTTNMTPNPPEIEDSPVYYLALGDSYTIGESVEVEERWPVQLVQALREADIEVEAPRLIAQTGWTTSNLKDAIAEADLANEFALVSLLIGVNNQYQGKNIEQYTVEFEQLLLRAIKLAGDDKDKVLVVSIPDYGATPFGASNAEYIGTQIDAFNAVNKEITEKHDVRYFDITPISRQAKENSELTANDGLHPSGEMYRLWVELMIEEGIKEMLQD